MNSDGNLQLILSYLRLSAYIYRFHCLHRSRCLSAIELHYFSASDLHACWRNWKLGSRLATEVRQIAESVVEHGARSRRKAPQSKCSAFDVLQCIYISLADGTRKSSLPNRHEPAWAADISDQDSRYDVKTFHPHARSIVLCCSFARVSRSLLRYPHVDLRTFIWESRSIDIDTLVWQSPKYQPQPWTQWFRIAARVWACCRRYDFRDDLTSLGLVV